MKKNANKSFGRTLLDNKSYLLVEFIAVVCTILTVAGILTKRTPIITPDLLTQIAFTCGYENMRTFRRAFIRETGELPAAYMRALCGPLPLGAADDDAPEKG